MAVDFDLVDRLDPDTVAGESLVVSKLFRLEFNYSSWAKFNVSRPVIQKIEQNLTRDR